MNIQSRLDRQIALGIYRDLGRLERCNRLFGTSAGSYTASTSNGSRLQNGGQNAVSSLEHDQLRFVVRIGGNWTLYSKYGWIVGLGWHGE
jgi:hypothetical protein